MMDKFYPVQKIFGQDKIYPFIQIFWIFWTEFIQLSLSKIEKFFFIIQYILSIRSQRICPLLVLYRENFGISKRSNIGISSRYFLHPFVDYWLSTINQPLKRCLNVSVLNYRVSRSLATVRRMLITALNHRAQLPNSI